MIKAIYLALALTTADPSFALAEDQSRWPVKPSEAAMIAQRSAPGATVLNVRALPNGQYVVTLRQGNKVLRVNVNALNGAVN